MSTDPREARAIIPAERYRLLVESVQDYAMFMLDERGYVTSWNKGLQRLKGYTADEIIGRHFSVFYPPDAIAAGKPERELAIARKEGRVEDEGIRLRKDGSRFWANVVITALRMPDGELIGFSKVTRDLTDRRQAEEALRQSEERLRLLVESVRDYAIYMIDPGGRILSWNSGAERLKGYSAAEVIGKSFSMFFRPEDAAEGKPEQEMKQARETGRAEYEGYRVRKDGSVFWANVILRPMLGSNGELVGFAKVTRDLTERRRVEAERVQLARAEAEVRLRDEFLSIASHELRTPLAALRLQIDSLTRQLKNHGVDAPVLAKAEKARAQLGRLENLVMLLLDVTRITSGRFELQRERTDLNALLADAVERLQPDAEHSRTRIELESPGPVIGDWDSLRLEQVIGNLITNALKYGGATPVKVKLDADEREATFSVRDSGPGIPVADQERIFARFERATDPRRISGFGLGLWISRTAVEAHGGSISVRSAPGEGATFLVRLPRERS